MTDGAARYHLTAAPPSLNNATGNNRAGKGGRTRTQRYQTWRRTAGWELVAQGRIHITGPFGIRLFYLRAASKADLDNLVKPVLDCLESIGFIENDRDCYELAAAWRYHLAQAVEFEIYPVTEFR